MPSLIFNISNHILLMCFCTPNILISCSYFLRTRGNTATAAVVIILLLFLYVKWGNLLFLTSPRVPSHSSCSVPGESSDRLNHPRKKTKQKTSSECVKARPSWLLRERQSGQRCLEASAVFFWLKLQPDSSVSFRVKTKTFGVNCSQLEHISYLLSLMLQARFTFS